MPQERNICEDRDSSARGCIRSSVERLVLKDGYRGALLALVGVVRIVR